jgi:TRAP-type mannitol/chloroaromatic compound transport system permease small subunit
MGAVLSIIDRCNVALGRAVSWLTLLMVLIGTVVVFIRYVMHEGSAQLQEAMMYMHGIVFLCAAGYALSVGAHVRVDFIYERLSMKKRAWIDIVGAIVLLIPFSLSIFLFSITYVKNSWAIWERSADLRGLPGVFLIKTLIWVFAISLLLQAFVQIARSVRVLQGKATVEEKPAAHA